MRVATLIIETEVEIHSNKFAWLCEMWKCLCFILSYRKRTLNLCFPIMDCTVTWQCISFWVCDIKSGIWSEQSVGTWEWSSTRGNRKSWKCTARYA